ncbi:MAG: phosphate signaling complex protein PhoU [bacterium]|nr:phosphate signaling complex protein PhoU [bacterium]
MTMRTSFDHELKVLNEELTEMGTKVVNTIEETLMAFQENDQKLATKIIRGDREVDEMERTIESRCLNLMLRQQPVAKDLRHISMALKVVTDLERIGDHAADIAELVLHLDDKGSEFILPVLPDMVASVKEMLQMAIDAFIRKDVLLARKVEKQDDVVDDYFNQVKKDVASFIQNEGNADKAVDLLMIAKYLERIADHAVNVCEWTEFHDTGEVKNHRIL